MKRREFIGLIASSMAWPAMAQAQKAMPANKATTSNSAVKDKDGEPKTKSVHRRSSTARRPRNGRGKSDDYVYGKVHYRLKPTK